MNRDAVLALAERLTALVERANQCDGDHMGGHDCNQVMQDAVNVARELENELRDG